MSFAIRAQGVSKRYRLGEISRRELFADLHRWWMRRKGHDRDAPSRRLATEPVEKGDFWALKDVSFEIEEGDTVGIIGANGAGKSTLLKIISRITAPTTGSVKFRGRIGSLLEVGTGFHPELTGRDNVFLNGAILGMSKAEVRRKFDDIVSFAELDRFIDTPVKRYSSGMYVRLAFSVAAFLEPEILIVDEALSVGDKQFQARCAQRIREIMRDGKTLLFVSHDMRLIREICSRAVLLRQGRIVSDASSEDAISKYLEGIANGGSDEGALTATATWPDDVSAPGSDCARLLRVRALTAAGTIGERHSASDPFDIEMSYRVLRDGDFLVPSFHFYDSKGETYMIVMDADAQRRAQHLPPGVYTARVRIPADFLAPGTLRIVAALATPMPRTMHFYHQNALILEVYESPVSSTSVRGKYEGHLPGFLRPRLDWKISRLEG
jgi:lipopolysaccharide transport system ATP-binding protein